MKDLGSMNITELKEELKREKAWFKECETNAYLSRCEIKHLEEIISELEEGED